MTLLAWSGLARRTSIIGNDGPVVSLTTYGERFERVHLTILSIATGSARPSRIILWLDDERLLACIPATLRRMQNRGLEIRLTENLGPHTKYYPYVDSIGRHIVSLVTADDDILYPRNWLAGLVNAQRLDPSAIWCYRARRLTVIDGRLAPYQTWPESTEKGPDKWNFLTGVSGVVYPAEFLNELRKKGPAFKSSTPHNDDVYLHKTAVELGVPIGLIDGESRHFDIAAGTQGQALMHSNVATGRNDKQIAATYTADDIQKLDLEGPP